MKHSTEDIEEMSYQEMQETAKDNDLNAGGTKEELRDRLKNSAEEDDGNSFGDIKKDIEDELHNDSEVSIEVKRAESGVPGMDDIVNGGIPEKNLVLVSGGPGSGKTTIGVQFLLEGIENGETGIYVNLDETKDDIIRNAEIFGWDLEKHEENDDLHFVRPNLFDFDKTKRAIDNIASRFDADRIVIDSLSVIGSAVDSEFKMRKGIMELNQRINRLDATTMTISEVDGKEISKHGVEEYSVDGIIRLYFDREGSSFRRGIAVKKMRGSDHSKNLHPIEIGNNGVKVYPDKEVFKDM